MWLPPLELAILSKTVRITEHARPNVVEYFNFFLQNSVQVCKIVGTMFQKQVIY